MEKYTMFMDQKNQYSENEYTTQSNLQIQFNPYHATNGILQKTRKFHNLYRNKKKKKQKQNKQTNNKKQTNLKQPKQS